MPPTLIETIDIVIDELLVDPTIQSRAQFVDKPTAVDYAEDMANGAVFPPIDVFRDDAGVLRLARGFQRVAAARLAGRTTFQAHVYAGGREDAILHAAGDNADHGLRRTNADKQHAVENVFMTRRGPALTNHAIAEIAHVSPPMVAKVRAQLEATGKISSQDVRQGRDGRTMDVSNIGGRTAPKADAQAGRRATLTALYDQHADYSGWVGEMNLTKLLDGMHGLLEAGHAALCRRRGPSGGILRWYQITPAGCEALGRPPLAFAPEPPANAYPGIDVAAPPVNISMNNLAQNMPAPLPPTPPPATVVHFHNAADHWNALSESWEDDRYVYIGRAIPRHGLPESPWHNPYKLVGDDSPAAHRQVIDLYRQHITPRVESGELDIETLRGKTLVCWCKSSAAPDTPCHGDVLVELLVEAGRPAQARDVTAAVRAERTDEEDAATPPPALVEAGRPAEPGLDAAPPRDRASDHSVAKGDTVRTTNGKEGAVIEVGDASVLVATIHGVRPYRPDQLTKLVMDDDGQIHPATPETPGELEASPTSAELPDVIQWLPPLPWKLSGYSERIVAADGTDVGHLSYNSGAGLILSQMIVELMNARCPAEPGGALQPGEDVYYEEWNAGNQSYIWRKVRVVQIKSRVQIQHPDEGTPKYVERRSLCRNPFGVPLPADTREADHAPAL